MAHEPPIRPREWSSHRILSNDIWKNHQDWRQGSYDTVSPRPLLRIRCCMSCIVLYSYLWQGFADSHSIASQFLIILNMSYGRFYPNLYKRYLHTGSQTQGFRYQQPQQHSAFNYSQCNFTSPKARFLPRASTTRSTWNVPRASDLWRVRL